MGQIEASDVIGEMQLRLRWEESSSSHHETTEKITLKQSSDNKKVVLVEYHKDWNIYKGIEEDTTEHEIEPQKLIEFIKENGTKIK